MWKKRTAVAENVYIADTPSFVTEKQAKIAIDYGGIPGDLHFGLTKKPGQGSRCIKEERRFSTGGRFRLSR